MKAAEKGKIAQLRIGVLYEKGLSVSQDYQKAVYWYSKAAEKVQQVQKII
jgi:TPR repeat protein